MSILNNYYNPYKRESSTIKRPYPQLYTSSSRPIYNSIKKDPQVSSTLMAKSNMPPTLNYYQNPVYNKPMVSSVK